MSQPKKDNHPNASDHPGRPAPAPIPFLSFSNKLDPGLKEKEDLPEEVEHSEDENLLKVPGPYSTPKKGKQLNVPDSLGDSKGNGFLRLTPDTQKTQSRAGSVTNVQKEVQFEDQLPSAIDPALLGQSTSRPASANAPKDVGHSQKQFPASAKVPELPDQAGHTPMPARFSNLNPQFGKLLQQSINPLAGPTNFSLLLTNSGEETSSNPGRPGEGLPSAVKQHNHQDTMSDSNRLSTDRSDNDLPSTVRQYPRHQQAFTSDSDLPSTARPTFPQHARSRSGLPADVAALTVNAGIHPMSAITRQVQQRTAVTSAPATASISTAVNDAPAAAFASTSTAGIEHKRGRPSHSSRAQMLAMNNIVDPFVAQPAQQAIPRAASAGPSRPIPATAAVQRPPPNPNNPLNKFHILFHFRNEADKAELRYLLGTGPLVLHLNSAGYVSYYALTQELNNMASDPRNWFGLRTEMSKATMTVPASATAPGYEQRLELKRIVLRYDNGCGWDEESAGPYDTPITNTDELDRALHLVVRRGYRDFFVAYFGYGDPIPLIQSDPKGKGKRVLRREDGNDDEGGSKKARTRRSASVEILGSRHHTG
jgi:hypothetical protein